MTMSLYGRFQIHQLGETPSVQRGLGIATMFAAIVVAGDRGPISIVAEGDDIAPRPLTEPQYAPHDQWSLWSYSDGRWRFCVIGGNTLDDLADEIISVLSSPMRSTEELRICPPGAPHPTKLS